jgi:hypothetical protein
MGQLTSAEITDSSDVHEPTGISSEFFYRGVQVSGYVLLCVGIFFSGDAVQMKKSPSHTLG